MPAETATPTPAPSRGKTLSTWLSNNGAIVGLALVCLIMFIATPAFLTIPNLLNVGVQAAVTAVIAFGMTYVIVTAGIDLSVGSIAALSAIGAGWMVTTGAMPGPLALILAPLMGLIAGSVTGTAVAYGKLPAFIATLAMLSIARGLALVISEGRPILMPDAVNWLGSNLGPIPGPILVLLLAWAVTAFILNRTVFGRSLYAIGGNEEAARLTGLPVKRTLASVYALSGLYSGVAGLLLAGRLASAQPQAATGYELDAIAAVVIGGASLTGGSGKATGTLIGALVLAVIRNGLNLLSVTAFWQQVVIGLVIAAAVGIDVLRNRK
ncbi:Ribose transport system permease protein rbsC [Dermatophilus congolensis]|uniref:Ribose transport system permease protein rbsC n=1 Tax=Dermatophilus congolensis TaxID=1863 RepID=A0AA46BL95_9MICO|nr:ABC transporter permease [Dermatophilus congolensis]STD03624.1 Ribose transport system permease protein rbsC [Dermatophilus congolensis]